VIEAANSGEAIRILDCIPVDVLFFGHRHARQNGRSCTGAMGASAPG
jgi:hypothetical protein